MASTENSKRLSLGRWAGTSIEDPFNDFTEVDIFEKDEDLWLQRRNAISVDRLEGQIIWDSASEFHTELPNWLKQTVEVTAKIHADGDHMFLDITFSNDGMTGLDETIVRLTKAGDNIKQFQTAGIYGTGDWSKRSNIFQNGQPSDINMSAQELNAAIDKMLRPDPALPDHRVDALLLLKDGKVVIEEYLWGMEAQAKHQVASITKTVVGILCGIAMDQGKFTLDDVVSEEFPQSKSTWAEGNSIRVRHLLSMTSGAKFGISESKALMRSECVEDLVLGSSRIGQPDETWHYDNGAPALLAVLLEKKTGMSLEKFAEKYLFGPLGITKYKWIRMRQPAIDGSPLVLTAAGMFMTVPDCAKIGQMMLDKGVYKEQRILSAEYVHQSTQQQTPKGQYPYGFCWHLNTNSGHITGAEDAFIAIGTGEQVIFVVPSKKIVLVTVGSSWQSRLVTPVVLKTFSEIFLNKLGKKL